MNIHNNRLNLTFVSSLLKQVNRVVKPLDVVIGCTYTTRMKKKLTITVDEEIYTGLHRVIGKRKISQFIESLVSPHVLRKDLESGYRDMAANEVRESEALEWAEDTMTDVDNETW